MKNPICAIVGAALLLTAVGAASPAHADICDQFGSAVVAGNYIVQNNRWNNNVPGRQCIAVKDNGPGFAITTQTGSAPTNGAPVSYPSIYIGCHYGNCSPGNKLPIKVESIMAAKTSINLKYVEGAIFDAAYDIWLDPNPKRTGVNQQEIMIWLNKQGKIQPVSYTGQPVDNVSIAGQNWQVWLGFNGQNDVISYVASSAIPTMAFNVLDFIADAAKRSKIGGFYLTSIQAGFEPWQGGQGLAIEHFGASVDPR